MMTSADSLRLSNKNRPLSPSTYFATLREKQISPSKSNLESTPQFSHRIVVAVDFGTTYSGYAYSFTSEPDNVHIMRKWEGDDPGMNNQKTPTILLLNPTVQTAMDGSLRWTPWNLTQYLKSVLPWADSSTKVQKTSSTRMVAL